MGGRRHAAHRAAWMLFRGEIGPGMVVCHKCDVRACVNPDHLFLGTAADNAQDMVTKGRTHRGERHHTSRLTAAQVIRIKTMLADDRMYMSDIAREFGVSPSTIRAIKAGKTWRDVEPASVVPGSSDPADED